MAGAERAQFFSSSKGPFGSGLVTEEAAAAEGAATEDMASSRSLRIHWERWFIFVMLCFFVGMLYWVSPVRELRQLRWRVVGLHYDQSMVPYNDFPLLRPVRSCPCLHHSGGSVLKNEWSSYSAVECFFLWHSELTQASSHEQNHLLRGLPGLHDCSFCSSDEVIR